MTEIPKSSLLSDSLQLIRAAVSDVGDIWRHEGLKRSVDRALYLTGSNDIGRWTLQQLLPNVITFDSALVTDLGRLQLDGPVGVAAGWDKTGKTILGWQTLGADHITVGGVPAYPQTGNPMPRLRTFDSVVGDHGTTKSLNSYGFYSPGAPTVLRNIAAQKDTGDVNIPVIVQVTVNKEMYNRANRHLIPGMLALAVNILKPVADAIEVGITSPNTKGMRDDENTEEILYIRYAAAKEAAGDLPFGFKADGDGGEQQAEMNCRLALRLGADYIALINTTAKDHIKAKYGAQHLPGGIAGADPEYQQMALDTVKYVYEAIGDHVGIMGMGGINSAEQAYRMLTVGASAIGINTGIRDLGARAMYSVRKGLSDHIEDDPRVHRLKNLIGIESKRGPKVPLQRRLGGL